MFVLRNGVVVIGMLAVMLKKKNTVDIGLSFDESTFGSKQIKRTNYET